MVCNYVLICVNSDWVTCTMLCLAKRFSLSMNRDVSKWHELLRRQGRDLLDGWTMAENMIGKLSEFDRTSDSLSVYVEWVNLLFEANEIAQAKCMAVFLSAIGEETFIGTKPPDTNRKIKRSTRLLTY